MSDPKIILVDFDNTIVDWFLRLLEKGFKGFDENEFQKRRRHIVRRVDGPFPTNSTSPDVLEKKYRKKEYTIYEKNNEPDINEFAFWQQEQIFGKKGFTFNMGNNEPELRNSGLKRQEIGLDKYRYSVRNSLENFRPNNSEIYHHYLGCTFNKDVVPAYPDAIETLWKLAERRDEYGKNMYDIHICSAGDPNHIYNSSEKLQWIRYFLDENGKKSINGESFYFSKRLILTKDKKLVKGSVLIDDSTSYSKPEKKGEWKHLLFGSERIKGLNKDFVYKWKNVPDKLEEMIGGNNLKRQRERGNGNLFPGSGYNLNGWHPHDR